MHPALAVDLDEAGAAGERTAHVWPEVGPLRRSRFPLSAQCEPSRPRIRWQLLLLKTSTTLKLS